MQDLSLDTSCIFLSLVFLIRTAAGFYPLCRRLSFFLSQVWIYLRYTE
nr:MAG TPA: hypothetical protein [Caudoviricetes sp.]